MEAGGGSSFIYLAPGVLVEAIAAVNALKK